MALTNKQNLDNLVELIRDIAVEFDVMDQFLYKHFHSNSSNNIFKNSESSISNLKSIFNETINLFPSIFLKDLSTYSTILNQNITKTLDRMNNIYFETYYLPNNDPLLKSYIIQIYNLANYMEKNISNIENY